MSTSVGTLLLALDEANKGVVTDITRMKAKIIGEDFKLARTDKQRTELKIELENLYEVALQIQASAGFVAKGCGAAYKLRKSEGDLRLRYQKAADAAYDAAMEAHRKALRILNSSDEVPVPPKEPTQPPPAPKVDEPKSAKPQDDKKVAGAPLVPALTPAPPKAKGEDKEPHKPAESAPSTKKEPQKTEFEAIMEAIQATQVATEANKVTCENGLAAIRTDLSNINGRLTDHDETLGKHEVRLGSHDERITKIEKALLELLEGDESKLDKFLMELPDPRKAFRRRNSDAGPTAK